MRAFVLLKGKQDKRQHCGSVKARLSPVNHSSSSTNGGSLAGALSFAVSDDRHFQFDRHRETNTASKIEQQKLEADCEIQIILQFILRGSSKISYLFILN